MKQETKRPIALEDILRLKRAERPPPEFWATFDRELRAKQLAALVEKRPWWRTLPRPLFGFSRYHLPVGAAAILAITFLATRDFRPATTASTAEPSVPVVAEHASVAAISAPMVAGVASESSAPSVTESAVVSTGEISAAESLANAETLAPGEVTRLLLGSTEPVRSDASSRSIAEHFKIAQAAAPAIERGLLSQNRGFEGRALSARATAVDPLAQMTSPAAARSAKFNSVLASSFVIENSTRASDRVARRLSNDDDRLHETALSRIKARGDDTGIGASFKF